MFLSAAKVCYLTKQIWLIVCPAYTPACSNPLILDRQILFKIVQRVVIEGLSRQQSRTDVYKLY
jgi:hypothetical protein